MKPAPGSGRWETPSSGQAHNSSPSHPSSRTRSRTDRCSWASAARAPPPPPLSSPPRAPPGVRELRRSLRRILDTCVLAVRSLMASSPAMFLCHAAEGAAAGALSHRPRRQPESLAVVPEPDWHGGSRGVGCAGPMATRITAAELAGGFGLPDPPPLADRIAPASDDRREHGQRSSARPLISALQ
jgi:hypothetical protein